jgi:hypothetical protein
VENQLHGTNGNLNTALGAKHNEHSSHSATLAALIGLGTHQLGNTTTFKCKLTKLSCSYKCDANASHEFEYVLRLPPMLDLSVHRDTKTYTREM